MTTASEDDTPSERCCGSYSPSVNVSESETSSDCYAPTIATWASHRKQAAGVGVPRQRATVALCSERRHRRLQRLNIRIGVSRGGGGFHRRRRVPSAASGGGFQGRRHVPSAASPEAAPGSRGGGGGLQGPAAASGQGRRRRSPGVAAVSCGLQGRRRRPSSGGQQRRPGAVAFFLKWKGRQRAIEQLYCPWEESFHMLYNFKAEVEFRSPGSFVEIGTKTVNGDIYFHRFFLAFKPCIDGFVNGCRPYLSIDSTALNGKWNGHLAAVTALDGHNWMFPVAFGFLESESADNWTWFMQQLKKAIGHQSILAVSTDACKGLENAVNKVFPGTEQRECFRHLMLNFVKKFHGDVFGNMWPAASAYTPERFEYHMNKILTSCPNVADYLNRHHNLLWMRSKFSTEIKCEYINNNLAESFNSWIKDIKDLPVVDLADKLHEMIMELFDKRRRIGERLDGYILPAIVHQLNARTRGLANLTVKRSANHSAQVIETDENHKTVRHVVQLLNHECTCREWQLTGKPCSHALAFITTERNASMESFVHEYYTLSKFRAAYEGVIEPMTDKSQWPQVDPGFKMQPPLKKRSSGRPRKLRFKNCFEKGGDAAKKQHKCKQCGELGHRQAGCPLNGPKKRMTKSQKKAKSKEIHTPKKMRTSFDATTTDSPGPMTRRQLALSIGEGASQSAATTSRMTTRSPAKATANKKLTPKRKRN